MGVRRLTAREELEWLTIVLDEWILSDEAYISPRPTPRWVVTILVY